MLPKLLVNHLHNDLGELFLLLVIQGKYHFDYLFNLWATLHLLSPYLAVQRPNATCDMCLRSATPSD